MTNNSNPQVIILCEDKTHYHFARKYFMCHGYEKRKIFSNICPKGRGAGEKYVHDNFAKELKAYRSKKNYLDIVLVVVIDADLNSIEDRIKFLGKKNQRLDDEKVAIFIPKKNIETWFRYLR